ncbi:ras-related protein Rab-18-B-like [Hetaerina americana]|uniref:ras-related protein Rab-18-B-like n=1 Tax=Hetaerina americana TaxID=62018 RepID=UPI003A7F117C
MENNPSVMRMKIIMLGDSGVGKSSLLSRYLTGTLEKTGSTIAVSYGEKNMAIDNAEIQLKILDIAGNERFRSIMSSDYRDSHGVVIVYDVTDVDTFRRVENWLKEVRRIESKPVVIIVGNKIDQVNRRVPRSEGLQYSKDKGVLFMETSVLLGSGIGHIFEKLVRKILQERVSEGREQGSPLRNMIPSCSCM